MFGRNVGLAALAASVGLALAGCSAGGDQHDSGPPPSDYRAEASPPELMGAAPAPNADQAPDGLLGGPTSSGAVSSQALPPQDPNIKTWRRADGTLVTAMRPVPNPGARLAGRAASTPPSPSTAWTQRADVAAAGDTRTWRRADGTLVTAMRPVANPGAQRQARAASSPRVHAHAAPRRHATIPTQAAPVARAAPKPAAKPAPKPSVAAAAPKPAVKPVPAKPAPAKPAAVAAAQKPAGAKPATVKPEVVKPVTPKTVAPAPAPLKAVKPAEPTTPLAKPPVVAATPPAEPPKAAKPTGKLEQLQAAVATEATNGAVLAAGESLSKNQPGQVTLSLPVTLGDLIKKEAAKLGLTKAASKTSAYAQLSGEGYEVTPNGRQTAAVTPGEPATFAWQVKPGPDAKGQLKSEFGVALNGAKPAQEFALGTITKRVAAAPEAAQKAVKDVDFGSLNKTVVLPGLGQTSLKTVLGAALVLLAVIILAVVSRNASESRRRAERQRKFRARNDFGPSAMDVEPADHGVERPREQAPDREHHVNPFVAAAGGALVGAAATAAFNHHRDEQKAEEHHDPFPAQAEPSSVVEPPHAAPVEHVNAPAEHVQAVQPVQAATEAAPAPVEHTPFTFPPSETSSAPHVAEPHTPPQADGHGTRETKEHEPA